MAKYGITVNGRCTEVVMIPSPLPSWAANAAAFLAKQFPTISGWVVVPDNAFNGTLDNGNGTFTNPTQPTYTPAPVILSKKACRLRVINALMLANSSTNAAARTRMQSIRLQVDTLTVTTDAHRRAKGAIEAWREDSEFSKIEFNTIVNDIGGGTDMTDNEQDAMLGTLAGSAPWPEQ